MIAVYVLITAIGVVLDMALGIFGKYGLRVVSLNSECNFILFFTSM